MEKILLGKKKKGFDGRNSHKKTVSKTDFTKRTNQGCTQPRKRTAREQKSTRKHSNESNQSSTSNMLTIQSSTNCKTIINATTDRHYHHTNHQSMKINQSIFFLVAKKEKLAFSFHIEEKVYYYHQTY